MSAGIRSGRELDPLVAEIENLRQGLDQQRLGQPRHAGDQAMTAGEERHQHLIDDGVLTDDDLADLVEDTLAPLSAMRSATAGNVRLRRRVASMCQRIDDFVDFHAVRLAVNFT